MLSLVALLLAAIPGAHCSWASLSSGGSGAGTVYGFGSNSKGSCSYGKNMANTAGLPWSTAPADASDGGTGLSKTYIALNREDLDGGAACGSCIWFRGTGPGIGVEARKISTAWQYGVVDNVCPECKKGALDLARSYTVGDGIWTVEWHAVPCQVGDSKLYYSFPLSSPYFFNMVVSNGRVPVKTVSAEIDGKYIPLTRTSNNQFAYHNSDGFFSFPMKVKVTPTCGKEVVDTIKSVSGGYGDAQFGLEGCPSDGNPNAKNYKPSPNDVGGLGTGSLSTESTSAERALSKPAPKNPVKSNPSSLPKLTSQPPQQTLHRVRGKPVAPAPKVASGTPEPTEKKTVLAPWFQCGNLYGKFRNVVCGGKGFVCVVVNSYYMQCRNNGPPKNRAGRRLFGSNLRQLTSQHR